MRGTGDLVLGARGGGRPWHARIGTTISVWLINRFWPWCADLGPFCATEFRLGVAYRARYESLLRQPGRFRKAVEHWERALALDSNQYIWRRRIQQYGPRLDKPYPFYDWIPEARADIEARGQSPVTLAVEPAGAEFAGPVKTFVPEPGSRGEPDPDGRIHRDHGEFIQVEAVTVPGRIAPGAAARAHLVMRPNLARKAHWNNGRRHRDDNPGARLKPRRLSQVTRSERWRASRPRPRDARLQHVRPTRGDTVPSDSPALRAIHRSTSQDAAVA